MSFVETFIQLGFWSAGIVMLVSFGILAKAADWLVDGAIGIAFHLKAPPILIGIVIVGIGTTAPELAVSVTAALKGSPAMALGNAIGSVIYDDGIALALAALFAREAIPIDRTVLRSAALFLIVVDLTAYYMCSDGSLVRGEGMVLVAMFVAYLGYSYWEQKKRPSPDSGEESGEESSWGRIMLLFFGGLVGVIVSSEWVVASAEFIARGLGVSEIIISLALVALGTSIPEVATCIIAARKGQGSLAVGNILGADILNICWIAGASAIVNPLTIGLDEVHFMFPAMLVMVGTMLVLMRMGHKLQRWKGLVLLGVFAVYFTLLIYLNPGGTVVPG